MNNHNLYLSLSILSILITGFGFILPVINICTKWMYTETAAYTSVIMVMVGGSILVGSILLPVWR